MQSLVTAFQAALIGVVISLLIMLAHTAVGSGDLLPGWATIISGLMSAAAVAVMGWLGFRYQDRHAARLRSDAARAVAAPIRAELLHYHVDAIKVLGYNTLAMTEHRRRNDPSQRFRFQYFPPAQTDMFESLRPRLGELGAFLAFEVATVYVTLPRGDYGGQFLATAEGAADDHLRRTRDYSPFDLTEAEGVDFCKQRCEELSKIERLIDLLFALERTGTTDGEYLVEEAGAHPAQLPGRVS
ncbi:MAG: hypothetical protein HY985_03565 [Magnetospirillum sp.]|nr:hypothetical protein [Magnetospirillum sp.]